VSRTVYCQPFDFHAGQIIELDVEPNGLVYLMTAENLAKYRAGRDDFSAEGGRPLTRPIELVARKGGRWYLVSDGPLQGPYRLRRGVEAMTGTLAMKGPSGT